MSEIRTVSDLRDRIEDLPDDTPVRGRIYSQTEYNPDLYRIDAYLTPSRQELWLEAFK